MVAAVDTLTAQALKRALASPGCPLCRIARTIETRQLERLLWENVNDVDTRVRLAESLGFCARHAWQFLRLHLDERSDALGKSIVFEDLIERVRRAMAGLGENVCNQAPGTDRWSRLRRRLGPHAAQPAGQKRRQALTPVRGCPTCEMGSLVTEHHALVLVTALASAEWQQLYAASDGLCLPHLRLLLHATAADPGLAYLLDETGARLARLQADLAEFSRKQAWQNRQETITPAERTAAERAVAFLVGSTLSE
jgi:hypothetical protein